MTPKNGPAFVEQLPIKKFHGFGPATAEKMHRLGIETRADLKEQSRRSSSWWSISGSRGHISTVLPVVSTIARSRRTGCENPSPRKTRPPRISIPLRRLAKVFSR
ncbi:hypothetical protein [Sinorhizobium meliloti]|uniref:hypothetical protein n=1 Tax=Rhizobium meliloti TaxID=382 RepID=UPI001F2B0952|nr:hypothetical protein [Sinorhizobium meliloti]